MASNMIYGAGRDGLIFRAREMREENGRRPYPIENLQSVVRHFVCRVTRPENPFPPHKHKEEEIWYVLEGEGILFLDGEEMRVEKGDMIILRPWKEHGLRTEKEITWLCIG